MSDIKRRARPEPPKPEVPQTQRFGIQFVVLRNSEPITKVITLSNMPLCLHEQHDPKDVWSAQAVVLTALLRAELEKIDPFVGVVPDARPVGLQLREKTVLDVVGVPILKRVNRVLLSAVERMTAYNRKRGR